MRDRVFLDTSYAVALLDGSDLYHASATHWAVTIAKQRIPLVTSEAIFLEIGNAFAKADRWPHARQLIEALRTSADTDVFGLSPELFARGWDLRCRREDKSWGLVDCTSFEVMRDAKCKAALTTDRHFIQAGFRALLLE